MWDAVRLAKHNNPNAFTKCKRSKARRVGRWLYGNFKLHLKKTVSQGNAARSAQIQLSPMVVKKYHITQNSRSKTEISARVWNSLWEENSNLLSLFLRSKKKFGMKVFFPPFMFKVLPVRPSALGILVVMVLKMLTSTRKTVTKSVMRPGTISGGTKKLIQETITNIPEGR